MLAFVGESYLLAVTAVWSLHCLLPGLVPVNIADSEVCQ